MIDDFRQRLDAAYLGWDASRGTTPAAFYDLMAETIEFRSVLSDEFPSDPLAGPFDGRREVIGYWTAFAESWELLSSRSISLVAEGDTLVWYGRVRWRHLRTLRVFESPKIDLWTVSHGTAVSCFEMFDTAAYARASGLAEPLAQAAE